MGACSLILHIHVVANWQLSKQGIRWPVSHYRIAGLGVDSFCLRVFLKLSADKLLVFQMIAGSSSSFLNARGKSSKVVLMSRSINILIDSGRENSASFYRREGSCFWLFSPWSLIGHAPSSHFHALIAQNLTGGFLRKIYALSGNLFSDSWSW